MLKFQNNKFIKLDESDMKTNGIFERFNLQEAIVNSWEEFTKEIKNPDLIYVGKEVIPDERTLDRIDILAFDPNESVPVVIELKRNRDKYQLLQAISYAAMISSWSNDKFLEVAKENNSKQLSDLEEEIENVNLNKEIKIILIAEKFDPEVIISIDWLMQNYELDASAIRINLFKKDEDVYFNFEQRYPLPELNEVYELRSRKQRSLAKNESVTWDQVRESLSYDWGSEMLDKCLKVANGDASRARFIHIRKNHDGLKGVSIFFRKKYLNIYIFGKLENPSELFDRVFSGKYELNEWMEGYSIHITTKKEYQEVCKWLRL